MKKLLVSLFIFTLILIAYISYRVWKIPAEPIHYHANFAVFINNIKVDFSDPSYMHLAPCLADSSIISFNKLDNIHLHDKVGNVAHVHQGKVVWSDLFASIKYDLFKEVDENNQTTVNYYLNGKKTDKSILSTTINKGDRLLISADSQVAPDDIKQSEYYMSQYNQVGDNALEYDNGTIGAEKCGSGGNRTLFTRIKIALSTLFSNIEL